MRSVYIVETDHVCTISLSLAKPGEACAAMPGPYSSLMVLRRRASRSGAGQAVRGRKTRDSADGALSDSTFNFKQRQWHAPQRGACHCQERIRQLVVFTPGSCP